MNETERLREDAAACDFVAQFLHDRERGGPCSLAEYEVRFPEFRARIRAEFADLAADVRVPGPAAGAVERVGPYRLIRRIGQGGQGAVFLAEHDELHRRAAVKILHEGVLGLSAAHVARLRREAVVLASLDHPGICAIYDAELDAPRPYLAMRYVEGENLAALLDRARDDAGVPGLPPRDRAAVAAWLEFFEHAALALHAAHHVGVVHRDVKPQNLMRTPDGAPVLLDFGLARQVDSTTFALTQPHEVFGTLPYMAPELLAGGAEPDPRADVYALGVALYEVLTGERPFAAATPEALRRQIEIGEATRVQRRNPALPRGAEVVVAAAIDADPNCRYATAAAFAEDLRRLRAGEPIVARRDGPLRAARRWARRHPRAALSLVLVTVGLIVSLVLLAQVLRGRRELEALRLAYQAQSLSELTPARALHLAVEAAHVARHPEIDDILLQVLDRCQEARAVAMPSAGDPKDLLPCGSVAADPAGLYVAVPRESGRVAVWRVDDGALLADLEHGHAGHTLALFLADGRRVLTGGADGVVREWTLDGDREERWRLPQQGVSAFVASRDGRRVAVAGQLGALCVGDPAAEHPPRSLAGHTGNVSLLALDPAGSRLLSVGGDWWFDRVGDGSVRVWSLADGAELLTVWPTEGARPLHAAWSADGTRIAVGYDDGAVRVHAVADGAVRATLSQSGEVHWVGFGPSDRHLATGGVDGLVVFDVDTGEVIARDAEFQDRAVAGGRFSADGSRLAVWARDNSVRVYDAVGWVRQRVLRTRAVRPFDVRWLGTSDRLVSLDYDLHVWFGAARPFLPVLRGHRDRVVSAELDRDGARALTASVDGTARIWRAADGTALSVLEHAAALRSARFAEGGTRCVTCCVDDTVTIWSSEPAGERVLSVPAARDAWFTGGDRLVVTVGGDGLVRTFDAETGAPRTAHRAHEAAIDCVAWHPSRPWIATGAGDRTVSVFDCARERQVFRSAPWPWPHRDDTGRRVFGVAFAPVGDVLVASCEDLCARAWDLATGRELWSSAPAATPGRIAFAADGARLLVAGQWSAFVAIHAAADGAWLGLAPAEPSNVVTSIDVSPITGLALCAGKDGRVSVFEVDPPRLTSVFRASSGPVLDARFSADGASIITASADGLARIWPVDPLPVAERVRPAHALPIRGR